MMIALFAQIPDPTNVIDSASRYSWEAGVLAFIIVVGVICVVGLGTAIWKFGWYFVYAVCGNADKGTRGIIGEWVDVEKQEKTANTEALVKITQKLEKQNEACALHVDTVRTLGDSLAQQIEAAKLAQEASALAAKAAAESNTSLHHIDQVLTGRTDIIMHTAEGVQQLKGCMFHWCDIMQAFVAKEFPASAGEVSAYLMAIKKKVNDAAA